MADGDIWLAGAGPLGIYRSQDGGANWGALIPGPAGQTGVTDVAIDPDNGDIWLAGSIPDGIYRSQDGGANWGALIPGPAGQTTVSGVSIDPDNGDLLLAGAGPDGIYRSQDGGQTWGALIPGPAGQTIVTGVAINPNNGDIWLSGRTPGGIYRSQDGGQTWGALISPPAGQSFVAGVAINPNNGDIWLAGRTPGGIYRSQDGGANWGALIPGPAGQVTVRDVFVEYSRAAPAFADTTGDDADWTRNNAIAAITIPRATGAPAPTYASVGDEPAGIQITLPTETADGSITGTPTAVSSGDIVIRATNSEGSDDWTQPFDTVADTEAPAFADNTGDAVDWFVGIEIPTFVVPAATGTPAPTYAVNRGSAGRYRVRHSDQADQRHADRGRALV